MGNIFSKEIETKDVFETIIQTPIQTSINNIPTYIDNIPIYIDNPNILDKKSRLQPIEEEPDSPTNFLNIDNKIGPVILEKIPLKQPPKSNKILYNYIKTKPKYYFYY